VDTRQVIDALIAAAASLIDDRLRTRGTDPHERLKRERIAAVEVDRVSE
jgi:hypothetical protein